MDEYIARKALDKTCYAIYEETLSEGKDLTAQEVDLLMLRFETAIKSAPAADVMVVAPILQKAVKQLHEEYDKATQNPIVRNPLAYALYQVWKEADQQEVRHE